MASTHSRSPSAQRRASSPRDVPCRPNLTALRQLQRVIGAEAIPLPGSGATIKRFCLLADWASQDLSLARLAEGHIDALAVRAEAGLGPSSPSTTYGVWAARSPSHRTVVARQASGWVLSGGKEFCSGAGMLDRALVAAEAPDGYRMFDVDLTSPGISIEQGSWNAVGMAGSVSATVNFERVEIAEATPWETSASTCSARGSGSGESG